MDVGTCSLTGVLVSFGVSPKSDKLHVGRIKQSIYQDYSGTSKESICEVKVFTKNGFLVKKMSDNIGKRVCVTVTVEGREHSGNIYHDLLAESVRALGHDQRQSQHRREEDDDNVPF